MGDGSERRQYVRLENSVPVMYWLSPAPGEEPRRSLTKNISGGGVCIYLDEPVLPGTPMQVQMRLPDQERSFNFRAEVVWCDARKAGDEKQPVMAGLRFLDIEANDQQAIIRHCMRRVPPAPPKA